MDFSNPFGTMVPRKMTAGELARARRVGPCRGESGCWGFVPPPA